MWGGPNFPIDFPSQKKFMECYPEVDVYVSTEGELGFSNVVKLILETDSLKNAKQTILKNTIDGCISRSETGDIHYNIPTLRISSLNDIPSPYQNGMMEQTFLSSIDFYQIN